MTVEDIKRIAVIGAGDMGHGIAEVALIAGIAVNLYDIKDEFVARGETRILESLKKIAEKGKVPGELLDAVKADLLTTTTDLEQAVQNADLVVEAIPEVLALKKELFGKIDTIAPKHTLFASNTSTMSITQLAAMTSRPAQVFGLHFFNPAVLMKLVEVIRADQTSDETIAVGLALGKKLGKIPVLVKKDIPGFIANRVNAAPATLFTTIIETGECEPEGIDAFLRMLGMKMGPCELTDFVGIDVAVNVMKYFAEMLHPDYGPPSHLVKMLEEGKLGKKSGQGYFDWSNGRPELDISKAALNFSPMTTIFVQINEATKLVEQGVCSINDVDLALINSSGNPMGPMTIGRSLSKLDLIDQLEQLAAKYNKEIFLPTQRLREGGHKH